MTTTLIPRTKTTAHVLLSRPCASCGDKVPTLGPLICPACLDAGYCAVCGQQHRTWQCSEVARVRLEMEAAEQAATQAAVAERARSILARYTAEDWDADAKARAWSEELLGKLV